MTQNPKPLRRPVAAIAIAIAATLTTAITTAAWSTPAHACVADPATNQCAGSDSTDQQTTAGQQQPSTVDNLTPAEWALCKSNLGTCMAAVDSRDFAFANDNEISGIDPQNVKLNDKSDAARHCLWQLSLATWFGDAYAGQWGNVHEENNDPAPTHAMDQHNNRVARSLAGDPELQRRKMQSILDGESADPNYVKAQMVRLCTAAESQAELVRYDPQASTSVADQLTPDPKDHLVYLTPNP